MTLPSPFVRLRSVLQPPDHLDGRLRKLFFALAIASAIAGYEGSITSAILTYAADDWGASVTAQSRALAVIRCDIIVAVFLTRAADQVGRRNVLLASILGGSVFTAICGASPNLAVFTGLQVIARGCVTASAILIAVLAAEHLPAGSRGWAGGTLIVFAAMGSACTLLGVRAVGSFAGGWRVLYAVPLISLLLVPTIARNATESHRFAAYQAIEEEKHLDRKQRRNEFFVALRGSRARLLAVGFFLALMAFENTPTRQLQNEYLRSEHGFSPSRIALFGILTNAPGLLGLFIGTRAADSGRRRIVALGVLGFAIGDAGLFLSHGAAVYWWSVFGATFGAMSFPALSVLSAELFPTSLRSTADGLATTMSRVGGILGLLFVGSVTTTGHLGRSIALTTAALWVGLVVLLVLVPETAGRELEDLNPQDAKLLR